MSESSSLSISKNKEAVDELKNILIDFCVYHGQTPVQVQLLFNGKFPNVKFKGQTNPAEGMRNILSLLKLNYVGGNAEKCGVDDWAEYCWTNLLYVSHRPDSNRILEEMNAIAKTCVHLVGNAKTAADVIVYYFLYDLMAQLSLKEKEKYIHLCRWFDNIQQDSKLQSRHRKHLSFCKTKIFA